MLEVEILGKPMRLTCNEDEKEALLNAVRYSMIKLKTFERVEKLSAPIES